MDHTKKVASSSDSIIAEALTTLAIYSTDLKKGIRKILCLRLFEVPSSGQISTNNDESMRRVSAVPSFFRER